VDLTAGKISSSQYTLPYKRYNSTYDIELPHHGNGGLVVFFVAYLKTGSTLRERHLFGYHRKRGTGELVVFEFGPSRTVIKYRKAITG